MRDRGILKDVKTTVFRNFVDRVLPKDLTSPIEFLGVSTPTKHFSEEFAPEDWRNIAVSVYKAIRFERADGVIVAHGTDTLPYTASALSFMLRGLKVPVVITGSNLPFESRNSDAVQNLSDATWVALQENFCGVFVVFSGIPGEPSTIHLGTRVRKTTHLGGNCFASVHTDPIGVVEGGGRGEKRLRIESASLLDRVRRINLGEKFMLKKSTNEAVALFQVLPGFNPGLIKQSISLGTLGIILNLYNDGTGPSRRRYSLVDAVKAAVQQGVPLFATSQHLGPVNMNAYESSLRLKEAGVIPLRDMIMEAAWPKLMWVLGQVGSWPSRPGLDRVRAISRLMLRNMAGEISEG